MNGSITEGLYIRNNYADSVWFHKKKQITKELSRIFEII